VFFCNVLIANNYFLSDYATSLAEAVQFETVSFSCDVMPSQFAVCNAGASEFPGSIFLQSLNNFNIWGLNMGILLGLLFVFRFITYVALRPQV